MDQLRARRDEPDARRVADAPRAASWIISDPVRSTAASRSGGPTSAALPAVGAAPPAAARPDRRPMSASSAADTPGCGRRTTSPQAAPELRIVVLEAQFCGFGASGRNGGWVSALLPGPARRYGPGVDALHVAMQDSIAEIERVASAEGIDAHFVQGGRLSVARTPAQLERLRADVERARSEPGGDRRHGPAGRDRTRRAGARRRRPRRQLDAALRADPARPAGSRAGRGRRARRRAYPRIEPGDARWRAGWSRPATAPCAARWIVRATEGYTAGLPGHRRTWLPMNSSMIVTAPLPAAVWDEIGWAGARRSATRPTPTATPSAPPTAGSPSAAAEFRTATARVPTSSGGPRHDGAVDRGRPDRLAAQHVSGHPRASGIAHTWSGVLGVPRDWCATVGLDRDTGLGWAGGYVGDGVTTSNLAGRTLTDLILGRDTELTALPWVGRRPRRWEPEPLR